MAPLLSGRCVVAALLVFHAHCATAPAVCRRCLTPCHRWLLFGEQGKIVTISKQRVAALQLTDLGFTATVMVMPGEQVTMLVAALGGALFEVRTRDCLVACILDFCETM